MPWPPLIFLGLFFAAVVLSTVIRDSHYEAPRVTPDICVRDFPNQTRIVPQGGGLPDRVHRDYYAGPCSLIDPLLTET